MSIEINGIAHIQLTLRDPERGLPFWKDLCVFMGLSPLIDGDGVVYCIGGRTGVLVRGAPDDKKERRFDQDTSGLHHICFRARSAADVDAVHEYAVGLGARVVHPPEDGSEFAPGYYSVLFEDPEGIRIEVNHVPGKGHFGGEGRLADGGAGPAKNYGPSGIS